MRPFHPPADLRSPSALRGEGVSRIVTDTSLPSGRSTLSSNSSIPRLTRARMVPLMVAPFLRLLRTAILIVPTAYGIDGVCQRTHTNGTQIRRRADVQGGVLHGLNGLLNNHRG